MKFSKLPIALAITAAMTSGLAYADEREGDSVDIDKEVDVDIDVEQRGYVQTLGLVLVDSTATAISDVDQKAMNNNVDNGFDTRNNAIATGDALNGATGNIGLNVAAGDDNLQQNSTSISRIVSPDSVGVSVQAGYDLRKANESSYSSDNHFDASASGSDAWNIEGSVSHSDSHSVDVDITDGTYNHTQNEQSSSNTTIDANVTGDIDHISGAGSLSSKGISTAEAGKRGYHGSSSSGDAGHEQSVGFISGESANLTAYEVPAQPGGEEGGGTAADPSTYNSNDTTDTDSQTTISANFSSSYSDSKENSFEVSGSASHESEYSTSTEHNDEAAKSSSYEYTEFARLDANLVFGAALDAETFSRQGAYENVTTNNGVVNTARLNGNVGLNASGNIGVNITAGSTNAQANQLAIAAGTDAVSALATASSSQVAAGNTTTNAPDSVTETFTATSTINLNQVGLASGSYNGDSVQSNDVYPELWIDIAPVADGLPDNSVFDSTPENQNHPCSDGCTNVGHLDFDSEQEDGRFEFDEAGALTLGGIVLTGTATTTIETVRYLGHTNNASISGNALRGASGNIGVNVSAGSNNLQGNSLAIASVRQSAGGGGGTGGGE